MIYEIEYKGQKIQIERLSDGKFKTPNIAMFCKQGRSVTWLDECRIPFVSEDDKEKVMCVVDNEQGYIHHAGGITGGIKRMDCGDNRGRFPANLLVSDDVLNDGVISHTGDIKPHKQLRQPMSLFAPDEITSSFNGDSGSFSRYFSLDAWWQQHVKDLPRDVQKTFPFLLVPKPSKAEKNEGLDGNMKTSSRPSGVLYLPEESAFSQELLNVNRHPTVKSIKLGAYLVTLGSRPGDLILDPFAGSGSFCISAYTEARHFIGIEIDPDSHRIAEARIKHIMKNGMQMKLSFLRSEEKK